MPATEYRVYGPPGTGKTTYIANQIRTLTERYGEDQVSVCSLTNTAIREAVGRDLPIDPENVATLHARCKRALNAPGPAESHVDEFAEAHPQYATDQCLPPALLRARRKSDDEPETTDEVLLGGSREPTLYEEVQILRQQMVPVQSWRRELQEWWRHWDGWMRESGRLDFTGWLETALREQALPPQQVVFVDEAQDHTPLQLEVIRGWRARHRVLVGDDDQNLYEWSGAIPDRFFLPELPTEREKVLSQSWRVPRAVHELAQSWVRRISRRKEKSYLPKDEPGEVRLGGFSLNHASQGILPEVDRPGTHMVLASSGYMLDDLIANLRDRRIPFHNPFRRTNSRWNPLHAVGEVLDAYVQPAWTGKQAYLWMRVLRSTGVYQRGKRREALEWLQRRPRQTVYIDDLVGFLLPEILRRVEQGDLGIFDLRKNGADPNWPYALDIFRRRDEDERVPRIIVGTIHSVKGGQADHVYLLPDLSPAASFDYVGPNRDRIVRLMYVGMTRTASSLTLCEPSSRRAVFW